MEECQALKSYNIVADHTSASDAFANMDMSAMSFLEEFIENSVSAGASNIDIDIIWPNPDSPYVDITIADNGSGIPIDIFQTKVFGLGQSGLRECESKSIHGLGGLMSLWVIQSCYPHWYIESITEHTLSKNVKYVCRGPIKGDTENGIGEEPIDDSTRTTGTVIYFRVDLLMFSPYYYTNYRFQFFINRLLERMGVKYASDLQEKQSKFSITINWKHCGERKKKGSEELWPSQSNTHIVHAIDWRSLIVRGMDDLPYYREITDDERGIVHIQHIAKLEERFDNKKAAYYKLQNAEIFPLRNHFQNITNPKCFYIYYRGMLVDNLTLDEIFISHTKLFDNSRFISVIYLDDKTDPYITNFIKNKLKRGNPAYDFLKKYLQDNIQADLSRFHSSGEKHEIELKREIVTFMSNIFKMTGVNVSIDLETVKLPFGPLDIVINIEGGTPQRKIIVEVKRGKATVSDFMQIKDYSDQVRLGNIFPDHEVKYYLLATDFAQRVIDRVSFFKSEFALELWKMTIDSGHVTNIEKFIP